MKTNKMFITVLTLAFILAAVPAFAQRGLIGGAVGGHTAVGAAGGAASSAGAQVGAVTSGAANAGAKASGGVQSTTAATAKGTTQAGTAAQGAAGAGIVTHIDSNPQLADQVQSMLPSGMSLSSAAAGFRNEGQFLAALHASQNLDIPFDQLKAKITGSDDMSLGAAIHSSKPSISEHEAKEEAKKAEREAKKQTDVKANASASARTSTSANANAKPGRVNADADDKTSVNASAGASVKR
jgi:hypothetical protein